MLHSILIDNNLMPAKPKVLYIHGTYVGTSYKGIKASRKRYGGLEAMYPEIKSGEIDFHYWSKDEREFGFWYSLSLIHLIDTYMVEKHYSTSSEAIQKLKYKIKETNPNIILTHSLGGRLYLETLNKHGHNPNLKKIITLANETPRDFEIKNPETNLKLLKKEIVWENYYCPWDQALWSSVPFNWKINAGLLGTKHKYIRDIFYPEDLFGNPHTSALRNRKFLKKVLSLD